MSGRAGYANEVGRPSFPVKLPVNRKRGFVAILYCSRRGRRGKHSLLGAGGGCVQATGHVPWLLAVGVLLRLGRVCSTWQGRLGASLRVPSYHGPGTTS
jgi:hypothetical protein